jgi:hypothetical protein
MRELNVGQRYSGQPLKAKFAGGVADSLCRAIPGHLRRVAEI